MSFETDYTFAWVKVFPRFGADDMRYAFLPDGYIALDLRCPGITKAIYEGSGNRVVDLLKSAWDQYPGLAAYYDVVAADWYGDLLDWLDGDADTIDSSLLDRAIGALADFKDSSATGIAQAVEKTLRDIEKRRQSEISPTASRINPPGYVYMLAGGEYYKIGCTNSVDKRLTQIVPKLPFEVQIVHLLEVPDMYRAEADLHRKFSDKRTNGEWFALDADDVAWFKAQTSDSCVSGTEEVTDGA
jgi:hypothetical protein